MDKKYLICRPHGGLNDTLCEIEKCRRYAIASGRELIIDTSKSGFYDNFWNYFENTIGALIFSDQQIDDLLYNNYQGNIKLWNYSPTYLPGVMGVFDSHSGQLLSFDFNFDYTEKVLLHESTWVGSFISPDLLINLRLRPNICFEVKGRLPLLGTNYDAVHVRNTDYTTSYKDLFDEVSKISSDRRILVCSDDYEVFDFAKYFFGERFFRISKFSNNNKNPLHAKKSINQIEVNLEMFADLFALSLSENLYFSNVDQIKRASGFSMLAQSIHKQKSIVYNLFH